MELKGRWVTGIYQGRVNKGQPTNRAHLMRDNSEALCSYSVVEPSFADPDKPRCEHCLFMLKENGDSAAAALNVLYPGWRKDKEVYRAVLGDKVAIIYRWHCSCGQVWRFPMVELKHQHWCGTCKDRSSDDWKRGAFVGWRFFYPWEL